jgi:hypothetical protein
LAIVGGDFQLFLKAKARNAGQLNEIAAVAGFGELSDPSDAANLEQIRPVLRSGMGRSSSAPGNGNTGMVCGRSADPR